MPNNSLDTALFDKAAKFAVDAHAGTERRGKGFPYILHPMEAAQIVSTITSDPELLAAAILHDTVEDTGVTFEQICENFGERVARLVRSETSLETGSNGEQLSWRERKQTSINLVKNSSFDAKIVSLGDKLSNIRTIAGDYAVVGDELWSRFHAPNGKQDLAWYYSNLAEALSPLADTAAYKEFVRCVNTVFADEGKDVKK